MIDHIPNAFMSQILEKPYPSVCGVSVSCVRFTYPCFLVLVHKWPLLLYLYTVTLTQTSMCLCAPMRLYVCFLVYSVNCIAATNINTVQSENLGVFPSSLQLLFDMLGNAQTGFDIAQEMIQFCFYLNLHLIFKTLLHCSNNISIVEFGLNWQYQVFITWGQISIVAVAVKFAPTQNS